ncbi:MAG TPA: hypothetical protein VF323_02215 [Candidatus Limnocylindrales bacterium]|jgi:hypothetical protein
MDPTAPRETPGRAATTDEASSSSPPTEHRRPTPGEVVRPTQRTLERPPSERYAEADAGAEATPSGTVLRAFVGAVGPAAIGGLLLVLLGSPLAVSEPLVVVALVLGLGTGVGARLGGGTRVPVRRRRTIAIGAALIAVVVAEVLVWQLALGEGGVLPFFDYQWLVFGPIAVLQPIVAGSAAWATA